MKIRVNEQQLSDINASLPWLMRQRDAEGRVVGDGREWPLVDGRVELLAERVDLTGLKVLETGCLDGHITVGLCAAGAEVTAFDVRPVGCLKAFARCLAFGFHPKLVVHDAREMSKLGTFDVLFHSGLFYHLADPVSHLREIRDLAPLILLDTHTAKPDAPRDVLHGFEGMWYTEFGWRDAESGVEERSFWLTKPELFRLIDQCGFDKEVLADADEFQYGPRSNYLLRRR